MNLTFLGTGTSQGIPVIGCDCLVCRSADPMDKRLRSAAMVEFAGTKVVIDVGPDFRQQMLRTSVSEIAAILITHEHNDHIIGMDDVRPFNFRSRNDMPVYCTTRVQNALKDRFAYAFEENPYPGAPRYELHTVTPGTAFQINGQSVLPIQVMHARMPVLGYRFDDLTYLTDVKTISEEALQQIKGTKVLVLNALRKEEHHSHLSLSQALAIIEIVQPQRAYLIHMSHRMGLTKEVNKLLPEHVSLAYDGLQVKI